MPATLLHRCAAFAIISVLCLLATSFYLGDVSSPYSAGDPKWKVFKDAEALGNPNDENEPFAAAVVWKEREGMLVSFTFPTPTGDWIDYAQHCYRSDGSLSEIVSDYRTFNTSEESTSLVMRVRRTRFNRAGVVGSRTTKVVDLDTLKVLRNPNFMDRADIIYRTTRDLPFWALLPLADN